MPDIAVENINKVYGAAHALNDVSFDLPQGSIYGFVGPNGAGKTTLIRIMAGFEKPNSGDIKYGEISTVDYPEKVRRIIGFMPDTLPDSYEIKVWEYLDFFARAFGLSGNARREAVERTMSFANLENLSMKYIAQLSKGMRQQVLLARVLIHDPEVLLLDEPAAGLDPRARVTLRDSLKRLADSGKTLFISSHILAELEDIVDGAVIIEKGFIAGVGTISDLAKSTSEKGVCKVVVTFMSDASKYAPLVRQIENVASVEILTPRRLAVMIKGSEAEYSKVMASIFIGGMPVVGTERTDSGLESVFMNTTRGDVQ